MSSLRDWINICVVVADQPTVRATISSLASLGYLHRGNLAIEGREAFDNPPGLPSRRLYVCLENGAAIRNHLTVRNYLRTNRAARQAYGQLKKKLAQQHPRDIDQYFDGTTEFVINLLAKSNMIDSDLKSIEKANRIPL